MVTLSDRHVERDLEHGVKGSMILDSLIPDDPVKPH